MVEQDVVTALLEPLLLEEGHIRERSGVVETDVRRQDSVDDDRDVDSDSDDDGSTSVPTTATTNRPSTTSRCILIFVALLYATFSISLRGVYAMPNPPTPAEWTFIRGWVSLICFVPFALGSRRRLSPSLTSSSRTAGGSPDSARSSSIWIAAAELGVWNFLSQAAYNIGLLTTTSARAAFLSQTCVIMTPLIAIAVGDKVGRLVWLGCLASFVGLGFLSSPVGSGGIHDDADGTDPADVSWVTAHVGLGMGDCLILFSSICWSFYILRTSNFGRRFQVVKLQGIKNFVLAVLYTIWWSIDSHVDVEHFSTAWKNPMVIAILVYSALFPGTIADLMQQEAQASVPASESTVLLSTEPIWTTALGFLLLGERLSWQESCGGCFLILGSVVSSL